MHSEILKAVIPLSVSQQCLLAQLLFFQSVIVSTELAKANEGLRRCPEKRETTGMCSEESPVLGLMLPIRVKGVY